MAAEGDFLMRYRAVSNKLKKRFLRKPNVAEASEQFGQLAKELKQQDCLQYAAFCDLAMARCEQTLFNAPGEALALTDAARLFLLSEKENRALQAPGFDEHLQAALNCYSFAIKVYIEMNQPVMAASLSLELGNALKEMNRPGEAIVHYQRAAELQTQQPIESLLSMGEMATCKILTRDYDGALSVLTEMQLMCQERGLQLPGTSTPVGAFLDIVAKCEISRVLLLMLLEVSTASRRLLCLLIPLHFTSLVFNSFLQTLTDDVSLLNCVISLKAENVNAFCSLLPRSCCQSMPRPWRDTPGSRLTLIVR
uniref:Coagulation factor VIII associated n=1 Tax=Oncorhynchus kisutch TaxID=8019 RepID=A0A8C7JGP3_ONCKI